MPLPSISATQLAGKIQAGKANTQIASQGRNSMFVPKSDHDTYGRDNLCASSQFLLMPGQSDCVFQGLISNETNMRPAYWRYIGDCDGEDAGYVGGSDNMILGYPNGPRGYVYDRKNEAIQNVTCNRLACSAAKSGCLQDKIGIQTQKVNFHFTQNSMAS